MLDQPEHGLQLVHTVGAAPENMQKQIELARSGKPFQVARYFHCEMASRSSIPG